MSTLERAIQIAVHAHMGQKDKGEEPYILHPLRIMFKMRTDLEHMVKSQYKNMNGIVVVRKGYIVFERYYNGYGALDIHNVASVTKSVTSALIGIAIDAGYIKSVDQKVLDFFPEYIPGANDIQKRTITIRHLLTMTAPIASKSTSRRGNEPLDRLRRQRNWVIYILTC